MTRRRSKTKYRAYARKVAMAVIILSVAMLFLWPYIRSAALNAFIPIDRGRTGTLLESVTGDALFSHWSSLVVAPANGTLRVLVPSNESVRVGQRLADIGSPNTAEALAEGLLFAERALETYEEETEAEFLNLVEQSDEAYKTAVEALFSSRRAYGTRDLKSARLAESSVRENAEAIRGFKARLSEIEGRRAELAGNVSLVQQAVDTAGVQVLSPASGILSWQCSEYDLTMAGLALVDKDASELLAIIRENKDSRILTSSDGQTVTMGDPVGRVVSGQDVSFYFPVKTETRPDVKAGQSIEVRFQDGTSIQATVTAVKDACPPGYSVLTGEIPLLNVPGLSNTMEINLITSRATGLIVPSSSIVERDGQKGVLTVQKTYARFTPVEVLATKGKEAVVKGIKETDEIVLRGMAFLEGRRVR